MDPLRDPVEGDDGEDSAGIRRLHKSEGMAIIAILADVGCLLERGEPCVDRNFYPRCQRPWKAVCSRLSRAEVRAVLRETPKMLAAGDRRAGATRITGGRGIEGPDSVSPVLCRPATRGAVLQSCPPHSETGW